MMPKSIPIIAKWSGWAAGLLSAGCYMPVGPQAKTATTTQTAAASLNLPRPTPRGVSVTGHIVYSADETRPQVERLLESARKSIAEGGARLDQLVQRWPDVAIELLRQSAASETDVPSRLAIAEAYDRVFAVQDPLAGWQAALAISETHAQDYVNFRTMRESMLGLFQTGQFSRATSINPEAALPAEAPLAWRAEALRLAGLAAVLDDKPDRAVDFFSRAARFADKGPRHPLFEISLLLSESQRRLGHRDGALAAWNMAVNVAAGGDVRDPDLWERAILSQPPGAHWPPSVVIAADQTSSGSTMAPDVSDVLIDIGMMRLSRGAPQPALLAFSRAESETAVAEKKSLARLYRVQSMIELHQSASAISMLEALMRSDDPKISRRAQAIEGDVLCRELHDRQHGIPLMQEAMESIGSTDWPGKTRLLANLGLYYILEGRDEEGLRRLHWAEARFESAGQWEDLAYDLKDEAAYLRASGKIVEADTTQKRADDVCRRAGLPEGPLVADATTAQSGDGGSIH